MKNLYFRSLLPQEEMNQIDAADETLVTEIIEYSLADYILTQLPDELEKSFLDLSLDYYRDPYLLEWLEQVVPDISQGMREVIERQLLLIKTILSNQE